jgi:hypothetical protein
LRCNHNLGLPIAADVIIDASNNVHACLWIAEETFMVHSSNSASRNACAVRTTTQCKPHFAAECKVSPTHDTVKKAVAEAGELMVKLRHPSCGRLHRLCEEELKMKNTLGIKIAAVAAFAALAGCTDLKPLQADIDSLKTQVGTLSSDVAAIRADRSAANAAAAAQTSATAAGSSATAAMNAANAASQKADAAQAAANAASQKADTANAAIADLNTKVDRMFQKSVSK